MPKIQYVEGDLLDFPSGINVACHCANCYATFGAGIALQIKRRYPEAHEADKTHHAVYQNKGTSQLGTYSASRVDTLADDTKKTIVNLYGQDNFGTAKRQLNYEAIYSAMERLKNNIVNKGYHNYVLGFPHGMGACLAGGSWPIIEVMIKDIFEPIANIQVIIVKYNK